MGEAHIYRQKLALFIGDIIAFLLSFVVAMHLRFDAQMSFFEPGDPPWEPMLQSLPIVFGTWFVVLTACGLYRVERHRFFFEFARLVEGLLIMTSVLLSITFFYRAFSYSRGFVGLFLPLLLAFTFFGRIVFRIARARIESVEEHRNRVLLVGASSVAKHLALVSRTPDCRLSIAGVLDDRLPVGHELARDVRVLGNTDQLLDIAKEHGVRGVIITNGKIDDQKQLQLLEQCLGANLEWQVVPNAFDLMLDRVEINAVAGVPLLGLKRSNIRGLNRILKTAVNGSTTGVASSHIDDTIFAPPRPPGRKSEPTVVERTMVVEVQETMVELPSARNTVRFCPNCGMTLDASDRFCPDCGYTL